MKKDLILCECEDPAHQLIAFYSDEDGYPCVFVTVHLSRPRNIFKRIWNALKYVFGTKRSRFGDFDEIVLKPEDADKILNISLHLKAIDEYEGEEYEGMEGLPIIITPNKYKS